MLNLHHKQIKRFALDGVIQDESVIGRLKVEYIRLLVSEMRLMGYIPRFDIEPDFTIEYNEEKGNFNFELSIYGIYAGRKQSEWIAGADGHKAVPTAKNKSKEFSQEQV
jgi:hypothetical protein